MWTWPRSMPFHYFDTYAFSLGLQIGIDIIRDNIFLILLREAWILSYPESNLGAPCLKLSDGIRYYDSACEVPESIEMGHGTVH